MTHADVTHQTETGTADIAAQLVAERFTPTTRDPGRARAIAAIHAFAEWLAQHPDVPIPDTLQGNCHGRTLGEVEYMVSEHSATQYDERAHDLQWSNLTVMDEPIEVKHVVFHHPSDNVRGPF